MSGLLMPFLYAVRLALKEFSRCILFCIYECFYYRLWFM